MNNLSDAKSFYSMEELEEEIVAINELDNANSESSDAAASLSELEDIVAGAQEEGGLTANENELMGIATEAILRPFHGHVTVKLAATESFSDTNRGINTAIALESVKTNIHRFLSAVKDFLIKLYLAISEWIMKLFDNTNRLSAQAKKLRDIAKQNEIHGGKIISEMNASKFHHLTTSSRYFAVSPLEKALRLGDFKLDTKLSTTKHSVDTILKQFNETLEMKGRPLNDERSAGQLRFEYQKIIDATLANYIKTGETDETQTFAMEFSIGGKGLFIKTHRSKTIVAEDTIDHSVWQLNSIGVDYVREGEKEDKFASFATLKSDAIIKLCDAVIVGCESFQKQKSAFYKLKSQSHDIESKFKSLELALKHKEGITTFDDGTMSGRTAFSSENTGAVGAVKLIKSMNICLKEQILYAYNEILAWKNAASSTIYICKESIKLEEVA